uniref:Uncharacterized protein n=1 Tax=Rhizophora mucronata TaxID=61149 RepID=A0A2P2NWS6_RHIMU
MSVRRTPPLLSCSGVLRFCPLFFVFFE